MSDPGMDDPMDDGRLSAALAGLPRERAGAGFTRRVLARLDSPRRRRPAASWTLAAAAAVAVLTLAFGLREWRHAEERRETVARLEQLLAEKEELQSELDVLRRLTADARPLVYLGSNERVDLVLDLERFGRQGGFVSGRAREATSTPEPGLRPADLRTADHRAADRPRITRAIY